MGHQLWLINIDPARFDFDMTVEEIFEAFLIFNPGSRFDDHLKMQTKRESKAKKKKKKKKQNTSNEMVLDDEAVEEEEEQESAAEEEAKKPSDSSSVVAAAGRGQGRKWAAFLLSKHGQAERWKSRPS